MKILPILICGLVVGLLHCTKEYSCESCQPVLPPRTTPNELITQCSVYIADESKVRIIYPQVKTIKWPGHYWYFDSIKMVGQNLYERTYDLKSYLQMSDYKIGDSFFVRYEIRYKRPPTQLVQEDTLVY